MMKNKNPLPTASHYAEASFQEHSEWFLRQAGVQLARILKRTNLYFKGETKARPAPDPAQAVIDRIEDLPLRTTVKELHYLTPPSLKIMRDHCPQCFFLPEDCPYVDYSIPDVRKAVKRINSHPVFSASPEKVIDELEKVNFELACHLREHYDLDE
jgi:hypothetical protein